MTQSSFRAGDRVKLRFARGIVRAGTTGTVQRVFRSIDAYDVMFDGHTGAQFVWGRDLELADDVPR